MQLQMADFVRDESLLGRVLELKKGERINIVVGATNKYDGDITLEDVEFVGLYDLSTKSYIDPNDLRLVHVRTKDVLLEQMLKKEIELSTPFELIKSIEKITAGAK